MSRPPAMQSHLGCRDITVTFGGVSACNKLAIDVPEGQIVGLIGPNGAGKTTLFNVLTRFQPYKTGSVSLRGEPIDDRKPHHMVDLGVARTFQNINLFGQQTTFDNILVGAHRHIGNSLAAMFWTPAARRRERDIVRWAEEVADMLHLTKELDNQVGNLPYGYQKRVELARALASRPKLILLDEPVAGCNDDETAELKFLVKSINRDLGITILLVEHDMSMVMEVCDYIYVISFGANLAEGTPDEVRNNPEVIAAYLGEAEDA